MPLPEFNEFGDLPAGVHPASLSEVVIRFGVGPAQRQAVTDERFLAFWQTKRDGRRRGVVEIQP